jgi:hypothetical protein
MAGGSVGAVGSGARSSYSCPSVGFRPASSPDTEQKIDDHIAKFVGEDEPLDCRPYISRYNARREWQPGWLCTQEDLLAADWEIAGE